MQSSVDIKLLTLLCQACCSGEVISLQMTVVKSCLPDLRRKSAHPNGWISLVAEGRLLTAEPAIIA